jgi:DNA ligase-1
MIKYVIIAETLETLENTTKKNEIINIISNMLKSIPDNEISKVVYLLKGTIGPDYISKPLGVAESYIIKALSQLSGMNEEAIKYEYNKIGDLGDVAKNIVKVKKQSFFVNEPLTVEYVFENFTLISNVSGAKSQSAKVKYILNLLSTSSEKEAKYIIRSLLGKLRLGVADMVIISAISKAFLTEKDEEVVENAFNISADLGMVAEIAKKEGIIGLSAISPIPGRPLKVMLGERAENIKDIVDHIGLPCMIEYKYDGLRLQLHKQNDNIMLFSRGMDNVTKQFPEITENARIFFSNINNIILDGELVAINTENGTLMPFQELSKRRGRKYEIGEKTKQIPVKYFIFDILLLNGISMLKKPFTERRSVIESITNAESKYFTKSKGQIANLEEEIEDIFINALEYGCEGIMAKSIKENSYYIAGSRGWTWIKYKKDYRTELSDTIDAVVVGAFYGYGKRSSLYGAYLLAVLNPMENSYETICKVGTGFSDEDLKDLYTMFRSKKQINKPSNVNSKIIPDVWIPPEVVLEIAGAEISISPNHTCNISSGKGLAVRFPRFLRKREDKKANDCTTTTEIIEMYNQQIKTKS